MSTRRIGGRPRQVLNLEELLARGFHIELARVFGHGQGARVLLEAIGYPREQIPDDVPNDVAFWEIVLQEIDNGLVVDGFAALIRKAHRIYLANRLFRQLAEEIDGADGNPQSGALYGANITVQGAVDPATLLDTAQHLAQTHSLGGPVNLGIAATGWIMLDLPGSTLDQAKLLANAIRLDLARRGMDVRVITTVAQFRDYLIGKLYLEGPDGARFELTDVPASTRLEDIARSVAGEYDPKVWKDERGQSRSTVVDHLHENGRAERLRPDTTLHQNGIGEDVTLHVAQPGAFAPPPDRATRGAPIDVFISYTHRDTVFLDRLLVHLALLKHRGVINTWTDREITAGDDWRGQIHHRLHSAGVVLLLVSADFLASDYCYDLEMGYALERHALGVVRVIPVVVNPCAWRESPLAALQVLPPSGQPISLWPSIEDAFDKTRAGIQQAIEAMSAQRSRL